MPKIHPGRYSARIDGDFVVFLIGMRLNRPWRVRHLPWFMRTMPRMLQELENDPDAGLLGYQRALMFGGFAVVEYWRSFEHLERYARSADASHLPAWSEFNRRIRDSGDIGIWHETYKVRAGDYEAIYGNMPRGSASEPSAPTLRSGPRAPQPGGPASAPMTNRPSRRTETLPERRKGRLAATLSY